MWTSLKAFYKSKEWEKVRLQILSDADNTCQDCGELAEEVHHIIFLTLENVNDYSISLNPKNLVALCHQCHNKRHGRWLPNTKPEEQKVFLIWGSPLSGKTTYVKEHMLKGDLVLDVDNIWECISLQPRYIHPDSLLKNMFAIREVILDNIKVRKGDWLNAWVIGGFADKYTRDKTIQDLGAEPIYIDATKEECIERIGERPIEFMNYINKWWEDAERGMITEKINPPINLNI